MPNGRSTTFLPPDYLLLSVSRDVISALKKNKSNREINKILFSVPSYSVVTIIRFPVYNPGASVLFVSSPPRYTPFHYSPPIVVAVLIIFADTGILSVSVSQYKGRMNVSFNGDGISYDVGDPLLHCPRTGRHKKLTCTVPVDSNTWPVVSRIFICVTRVMITTYNSNDRLLVPRTLQARSSPARGPSGNIGKSTS